MPLSEPVEGPHCVHPAAALEMALCARRLRPSEAPTFSHRRSCGMEFLAGLVRDSRSPVSVMDSIQGRDLGIPGVNGGTTDIRDSGSPLMIISGYTNFLNDTDTRPFFTHDMSWTTQQNFSLNRSRHDIRFGFEGIRHVLNHYNPDGGGNGGPMGRFEFHARNYVHARRDADAVQFLCGVSAGSAADDAEIGSV